MFPSLVVVVLVPVASARSGGFRGRGEAEGLFVELEEHDAELPVVTVLRHLKQTRSTGQCEREYKHGQPVSVNENTNTVNRSV